MKQKELAKYKNLYTLGAVGGDKILKRYLGLSSDFVLPLTLSHGLDFGCDQRVADVDSCEPIYWSTNEEQHAKAKRYKASILIPHPWILLRNERSLPRQAKGTLFVGPPPGRENDTNALRSLKEENITGCDILIKQRGPISQSCNFWAQNNMATVCAGKLDDEFYERLYKILSGYEVIVGCTLSSALFFAAALGKRVALLRGYKVQFYDTSNWPKVMNFSDAGRRFALAIMSGNINEYSGIANKILGGDLNLDSEILRNTLLSEIEKIDEPLFHSRKRNKFSSRIINRICLLGGVTGPLNNSIIEVIKKKISREERILHIKINEIDAWINGISDTNFSSLSVAADKRLGVWPGYGI
jgi:hypothetical protein